MSYQNFKIITASVTPMHSNGEVNFSKIEDLASLYIKNGVDGAFINGTTGECASLSFEEKKELIKAWSKTGSSLEIISMLGGTCLKEMQELAKLSQDLNLDGISILSPYYFKPNSLENLIEFAAEVAKAAPQLPFYFYHIPVLSRGDFSMYEFLNSAGSKIPNLAGIKYTHSNIYDLQLARDVEDGKYKLLWGTDEALLSGIVAGVKGAVGSTYNYATPLYKNILKELEKGNLSEAKRWQNKAVQMVQLLIKYGGTSATKAFLKIIGLDCGPCRLPLKHPVDSEVKVLKEELTEIGFFEFCSKI